MIETKSYRFSPEGDILAEKARIKEGELQLQILLNSMKFQNLKQGRRELRYADGTIFNITSCFGIHTVNIYVPPIEIPIPEEEKPKELNPLRLLYMGDPIVLKNADGEVFEGLVSGADTDRFYREYDVKKDLEIDGHITAVRNEQLAVNQVCRVPISVTGQTLEGFSKSEYGEYDCYRHDSVTCDEWTAHATAWIVRIEGGRTFFQWAVSVDYLGAHWGFPNHAYDADDLMSEKLLATWPRIPYFDQINCSTESAHGVYTPVHAMDIFQIEYDVDAEGWEKDDYILTICGDSIQVEYWNLTKGTRIYRTTNIVARSFEDFPDGSFAFDRYHRIIVLGLKELEAYFALAFLDNGKIKMFKEVWKYNFLDGTIDNLATGGGHCVAYNPFTEEIWHINHGEKTQDSEPSPGSFSNFTLMDPCSVGHGCDPATATFYSRARNTDAWQAVGSAGPGVCNAYWTMFASDNNAWRGYFGGVKNVDGNFTGMIKQTTVCDFDTNIYKGFFGWLTGDYTNYAGWVEDVGVPTGMSITENGTGATRTVQQIDGAVSTPAELEAMTHEVDMEFGEFDKDYAVPEWPYIAQYARVKHAIGTGYKEYEDIVLQKNIDGIVEYKNETIGENEEIFFVVMADYTIIPT